MSWNWGSFWLGVIHALITVIVGRACYIFGRKSVYHELHLPEEEK
jgi:hypothetical protein